MINSLREIGTSSIKVVAKLHSDGMVVLVEIELEEHKSTLSIDGRFLEAAASNTIMEFACIGTSEKNGKNADSEQLFGERRLIRRSQVKRAQVKGDFVLGQSFSTVANRRGSSMNLSAHVNTCSGISSFFAFFWPFARR